MGGAAREGCLLHCSVSGAGADERFAERRSPPIDSLCCWAARAVQEVITFYNEKVGQSLGRTLGL